MKMTIESTPEMRTLNGIICRIWQGKTEHGAEVIAFIPSVAVNTSQRTEEFERDLNEHVAPRPEICAFPLRMVL